MRTKNNRPILLVQDDGPGINQQQRRLIQRALNAQDYESGHIGLGLMLAIEKQSGISKVWSQLIDLIGSADGKKFRNFAQQYALDILLGYRNSHL